MPRTTRATEERRIRCEVCLKEIPTSEALTREGDDYVINFCGLDCHEEWIKRAPEPVKKQVEEREESYTKG